MIREANIDDIKEIQMVRNSDILFTGKQIGLDTVRLLKSQ